MYTATTPHFTFTLSIDTQNITALFLTFYQNGRNVITLTGTDVTMLGNNVDVTLTQEQTLLFSKGKMTAQFRVKLNNDDVETSNTMDILVDKSFYTEII